MDPVGTADHENVVGDLVRRAGRVLLQLGIHVEGANFEVDAWGVRLGRVCEPFHGLPPAQGHEVGLAGGQERGCRQQGEQRDGNPAAHSRQLAVGLGPRQVYVRRTSERRRTGPGMIVRFVSVLVCIRKESVKVITHSIVIPAYNEAKRLEATLDRVLGYVAEQRWDAEVLVVNDGSRDATREIVLQRAANNPMLRLVENPGNRGKGYSVRNGVLHAQGEFILFTDADLASPIDEGEKLLAALAAGADIAIGSRWLDKSLQTRPQPLYRRALGRIFNLALRLVLGMSYKDTQCGFKAFTRRAAAAVFPLQIIERWGFDPEILFLARRQGLRVDEVPVKWAHQENTKISPIRDGLRMFTELLTIRWYAVTGRYDGVRAGATEQLR